MQIESVRLAGRREYAPVEAKLIRVTAEGQTSEINLPSGRTLVGRQEHCQLRVPKPEVSREHCEFVTDNDTGVSLKDLGSSNGTYVNRARVDVQSLVAGDLVSLGGLVFVVQINGQPEHVDAALCYEDGLPAPEPEDNDKPAKHSNADKPEKPVKPAKPAGKSHSTDRPTEPGTKPAGLLSDEFGDLSDPEDSSVLEFDFDLDDDLKDQPEL